MRKALQPPLTFMAALLKDGSATLLCALVLSDWLRAAGRASAGSGLGSGEAKVMAAAAPAAAAAAATPM